MSDLLMLQMARDKCSQLSYQLDRERERRDGLALQAVDSGHTWREVAAAAGFANPYLARLKREWAARPVSTADRIASVRARSET